MPGGWRFGRSAAMVLHGDKQRGQRLLRSIYGLGGANSSAGTCRQQPGGHQRHRLQGATRVLQVTHRQSWEERQLAVLCSQGDRYTRRRSAGSPRDARGVQHESDQKGTLDPSDAGLGAGSETRRSLGTEVVAEAIAQKRGLGIARMIVNHFRYLADDGS